ncbi:MAG: hypothetical protein IH881_15615 [Myxococcales bacterium]|nr:hypothetical protein [Myxococcales bacterium]
MRFARSVRVGVICAAVAVLVGCGSSGGGSGDKVELSNPQGAVSADPGLRGDCQAIGFEGAWLLVVRHSGVDAGSRGFIRGTFLPSGAAFTFDGIFSSSGPGSGPGSGLGPDEISVSDCYSSGSDTQLRIELYVITTSGERTNTVSDTFSI